MLRNGTICSEFAVKIVFTNVYASLSFTRRLVLLMLVGLFVAPAALDFFKKQCNFQPF